MKPILSSTLLAVTVLTQLTSLPAPAGVLELDGVDSWVDFANPSGLIPTGGNSFTIEAWINPTSIPAGGAGGGQITFWGNQSVDNANGFRMASEDGLNHYFWGNDFAVDPAPAGDMLADTGGPDSDGWHHVAISYDGDTNSSTWYQNGAPIGTLVRPGEPAVADANFRIGARADGDEEFHGLIDELRIWDVARDDAAIAELFEKEISTDSAGLVAYFKFDGEVPDFSDSSGNGHDGAGSGAAVTNDALNAPVVPQEDGDMDGLPDAWEERWFGVGNLDQGPDDNPDNDGLTNREELDFNLLLNPGDPDTDDDQLTDGDEVNGLQNPYLNGVAGAGPPGDPTSPLVVDSDADGLEDGSEILVSGTDPNRADTDGDGVLDAEDPAPTDPDIPGSPAGFGALYLDGSSFLTFTNDNPEARIPTGDDTFTLEAWINPTSIPTGGANGGQISFWGTQGPANTSNGFRLRGSGGVRHYFWGNDHDEDFGIDILPDTTGVEDPNNGGNPSGWHHLAVTYDQSQTVWYWNGAQLGNPRAVSGVGVADANFRIGSRIDAEFFDGWIDELRVWNIARTADEIQETLNTSLAGNETGLVAYWNFTDGFVDASNSGHDAVVGGGNPMVDRFSNAPVTGGPAPLQITAISFDEGTRTATIIWRSRAGRTYAVDFTDDLMLPWNEIDDGQIATGEVSSFPNVVPDAVLRRFYRIRDVSP